MTGWLIVSISVSGFLTIGIPSVRRQNVTYLEDTIESLISKTGADDRPRVVFVVFLTDSNHTWVIERAKEVYSRFQEHVDSGLVQIVHPPHIAYPNFRFLTRRFGDSLERVAWRSKQNLDFAYLMLYSQPFSEFYLQIEDDVIVSKNYLQNLESYISACANKPWLYLRFSKLGFIGLLFKSEDLTKVSEFFMILFDEKPCDLLINDLRVLKGQPNELVFSPAIFQHMGLISSLNNKVQRLKDDSFKER